MLNAPRLLIVDALAAYGFNTATTNRSDPLGQAPALTTHANGHGWSLGLAVRAPFQFGALSLEPFARVLWQAATRGALNEGTATPAALTLPGDTHSGTRVMAGAVFGPANPAALATTFSYRARLAIGSDNRVKVSVL